MAAARRKAEFMVALLSYKNDSESLSSVELIDELERQLNRLWEEKNPTGLINCG